jgi:methyl-accepting chemotaxis protein
VISGVEQVFEVVHEQHTKLMKVLGKIQELSSITAEIGKEIRIVSSSTEEITSMAGRGTGILDQLSAGMKRISDSSRVMENIVTILTDIADKINLLSLNASIEAARAGVSGRGFAVVASEISRLGAMTQSSMSEIEKHIQATRADISAGLASVESTVDAFTTIIKTINSIIGEINGISTKTMTQQEINGVVNSESENLRSTAESIKDMMEMQQTALNEIIKSITSINEITQTYVEGSRRLQSDAKEVEHLAEVLKEEVHIQ